MTYTLDDATYALDALQYRVKTRRRRIVGGHDFVRGLTPADALGLMAVPLRTHSGVPLRVARALRDEIRYADRWSGIVAGTIGQRH